MLHPLAQINRGVAQLTVELNAVERMLNETDSRVLVYHFCKLGVPILLCGAAALAIMSLWQMPYVLSGVLVAIAWLKHRLFPIRFEVLWFCGVAALGAYAEAWIITDSGAWSYANWQVAHIPVWLPAIWGLVGISLMTGYAALTEKAPVPLPLGMKEHNSATPQSTENIK